MDEPGIHVKQDKMAAILAFFQPTKYEHVGSFLDLSQYYRQFIPHFSTTVAPSTRLLRKSAQLEWRAVQKEAVRILKDLTTTLYVL